jgi:hypothetical protein
MRHKISIKKYHFLDAMSADADFDWEEAFTYRPGLTVELKAKPGTFDTIARYEAMMVPSIWLENDPVPRYPHELYVVCPLPNKTSSVSSHTHPDLPLCIANLPPCPRPGF